MEGIEILNTFVEEGGGFGAGIFAIILGIVAIAALVTAICLLGAHHPDAGTAFIFSIILLCLSIACVYQSFFKEKTTYYQVIIDDSVSMVEFNEKYDIVNIEGKIYTIKEREN